jgi:DNA polymerase, archaea type
MAQTSETTALLTGVDPAPGLAGVAAQPGGVALWWRREGVLTREDCAFSPFFLLSHRELLDQFAPAPQITELTGQRHDNYGFRVDCEDWEHCNVAIAHVNGLYRAHKRDFEFEPVLRFTDPVNQYLLAKGRTHFGGLDHSGLNVLYFALKARPSDGAEYADLAVAADEVVLVGLADNHGWQCVYRICGMSEKDLLTMVCEVILERDPDVIVGHDIFKFGLSYFLARAKRHKLKLPWGRDGSAPSVRRSRAPAAEKQLEYPRIDIAGRSIVDTWFLAQYYDIVKRDLEQFDAQYVANYLDASAQLPAPLPAWRIDGLYDTQRELLLADVKYELQAAAAIFRTLAPSYFAQAQMLPLSLQDCVVRGNGMKINYLLMREYLRCGVAIPSPVEAHTFPGGHTEVRQTGLLHNVLNVDIASLYPSIMLSHGIKPATDSGDVFQPMLRELTTQRLAYKREAKTAGDPAVRVRADARQAALKVFINSFFGYLGTNRMNWADPMQAERITATGQALVKQLAALVEDAGGQVVEIDTDGVYFTAPEDCLTPEQREALAERLNAGLPDGITVELGGYFPAMLSHKVKNYALLAEDGTVTIKGSGMKSRGLEPYLHGFLESSIKAILAGEPERIKERHEELRNAISGRTIDISQLAKTDTLIDSLESYQGKISASSRNRGAAYEVALKAKRLLRPGDQVSYYVTGEKATVKAFEAAKPLREYNSAKPDYNVKYYLSKLEQNLKKVKEYLPGGEAAGLFS